MRLQNRELLHPKINCIRSILREGVRRKLFHQNEGQTEWVLGMFFLLFLAVLLCTQLQLELYHTSSAYLEDALAASNLASAVIDLEEYGISHTIQIAEPEEAYRRFCEAVKSNLQLNEEWVNDTGVISGKVTVKKYVVYNVKGQEVAVYQVDESGQVQEWQGSLGSVSAPNGILVETTSIYSEIVFPVKGLFGVETEAHKGKLVDIVRNGEE